MRTDSVSWNVRMMTFLIILILSTVSLAGAVSGTYSVRGYVKVTGTSIPVQGATVRIYDDDGMYWGSTSTNSIGYFSKAVAAGPAIAYFECRVTKTGVGQATKTAVPVNWVCDMGTIYMGTTPPVSPIISNPQVIVGSEKQVTVTWDVTWGSTATTFQTKSYWSMDSTVNEADLIYTSTNSSTHHSVVVPQGKVVLGPRTYWYKIYAINGNGGGNSAATTSGPTSHTLVKWHITPLDDACTYSAEPDLNWNDQVVWVATDDFQPPGVFRGYFKYFVQYPELVKSAVLKAYIGSLEPSGHGTISVYESGTDWEEETITYANSQIIAVGQLLAAVSSGSVGAPDSWDVLLSVTTSSTISFVLRPSGGVPLRGAHYYSKECCDASKKPYLEIEYYGVTEPPVTSSGFVSDTFSSPIVNSCWQLQAHGNPEFSLHSGSRMVPARFDIEDGGALVFGRYGHVSAVAPLQGYDVVQSGFSTQGAFFYRSRVYWDQEIGDHAAIDFSIQLRGLNGNLATIGFRSDGGNSGGSFYSRLYAQVGQNAESIEWLSESDEMLCRAYFEFQRYLGIDGYWRTRLMWRPDATLDSRVLVDQQVSSDPVTVLRIRCDAWGPYPNGSDDGEMYSVKVEVDSVKELSVSTLSQWADDHHHKFSEPLPNPNFESVEPGTLTTPQSWLNLSGSLPLAERATERHLGDGFSCHAVTSDSQWSIMQTITHDPTRVDFDTLRGNPIGFSYYAGYCSEPALARAVIRYWTASDSTGPIADVSNWFQIPSDGWVQVETRTLRPLPVDTNRIEVVIQGKVLSSQAPFDAYVDTASFQILVDAVSPLEWSYSNELGDGQRGFVSICLHVYDIQTIHYGETHQYQLQVIPVIVTEAVQGYALRSVEIGWSVLGRDGNNQAEVNTIMDNGALKGEISERNDKNYYSQAEDFEQWNQIVGYLNHPLGKFGVSLAMGAVLKVLGVPYPLSTVVSSVVTNSIYPNLVPVISGITDGEAIVEDSAHGTILYPGLADYNLVHWANQNFDLHWTVIGESLDFLPTLMVHVRAIFTADETEWPSGAEPSFAAYTSAILAFYQ